jgi:hypothetical protein
LAFDFDGTNKKSKLRRRETHLGSWDDEWSDGEEDRAAPEIRPAAALRSRVAALRKKREGGGGAGWRGGLGPAFIGLRGERRGARGGGRWHTGGGRH